MTEDRAAARHSAGAAEPGGAGARPDAHGVALAPGSVVDALALELPLAPLPADEVRSGAPSAGSVDLDLATGPDPASDRSATAGFPGIGVWEMTAGTAVDVEVDECFIVLAGRATVIIRGDGDGDGDGAADAETPRDRVVELRPGTIGRLSAGMRTEWTVHEDLRKVYLMP